MKINTSKIQTSKAYVCWIDIMGTKNTMSESFEKAANFMLRFHVIVSKCLNENVHHYPMMDGVYLTATNWTCMEKAIQGIFQGVAQLFIEERVIAHRFVIRGAVAYGQIFQGSSITQETCDEEIKYSDALMMGMPMIQAFSHEKYAPPFGVFIHESARIVGELQGRYYHWNKKEKNDYSESLRRKIDQYFKWCKNYYNYFEMKPEKIDNYLQLNEEYFTKMDCNEDDERFRIETI